jgi:hypothetical protein
MNSNESIRQWELSAIRAIKARNIYLFIDYVHLMGIIFGKCVSHNFIKRVTAQNSRYLSLNDEIWLSLNSQLPCILNDN